MSCRLSNFRKIYRSNQLLNWSHAHFTNLRRISLLTSSKLLINLAPSELFRRSRFSVISKGIDLINSLKFTWYYKRNMATIYNHCEASTFYGVNWTHVHFIQATIFTVTTQQTNTCSKLTMGALEKGMEYFQINNEDTRATSVTSS